MNWLRDRIFLAMLIGIASWAYAQNTHAGTYTGKVVSIADGDTVTVLDAAQTQHKVRLAGIDAPERKQPFGQVARQYLASAVFGKTVTIEWSKVDRYRREIGKVLLDGKDINLMLVDAGLAWHYKFYEREQSPEDRHSYSTAEQRARAARRGLWRENTPSPPWEFRRRK